MARKEPETEAPLKFLSPTQWPQHVGETDKTFGDRLNFLSPEQQHLEKGGLVVLPRNKGGRI